MSPDFSRRSEAAELMDQPCAFETFRDCLRDLAQVNRLTLAHRPTLAFLEGLRRSGRIGGDGVARIVDVGAGYGDLLRAIDAWARRRGVAVQLTGVDLNPWAARAAAEASAPDRPIAWATTDVFAFEQPCEVVVSSLFTHHLGDDQIVRFLDWMEARAGVGWFVNDLHRHPLPYVGFRLLAWAMRWHRFVRHDGPVSIARAFTVRDWRALVRRSHVDPESVTVRWRFPFRICLERVRER